MVATTAKKSHSVSCGSVATVCISQKARLRRCTSLVGRNIFLTAAKIQSYQKLTSNQDEPDLRLMISHMLNLTSEEPDLRLMISHMLNLNLVMKNQGQCIQGQTFDATMRGEISAHIFIKKSSKDPVKFLGVGQGTPLCGRRILFDSSGVAQAYQICAKCLCLEKAKCRK